MKLKKYFQQRAAIALYFFSILGWFAYFVQGSSDDVLDVYSDWGVMTLTLTFVPLMVVGAISSYFVALCGALAFGVIELGLNGFAQQFLNGIGAQIAEHLGEVYSPLLAVQAGVWLFATLAVLIKPSFKNGLFYGLLVAVVAIVPALNSTFDNLVSNDTLALITLIELVVLSQVLGFYTRLPSVNLEHQPVNPALGALCYIVSGVVSLVVALLSISTYLNQGVFMFALLVAGGLMVLVRLVLSGSVDRGSVAGGAFFIIGMLSVTFPQWGEGIELLARFVQADGVYVGLYAGLFCVVLAAVFCSTVVHASVPITLLFLLFNFTLGLMAYASKFPFLEATLDVAGFSVVYGSPLEFTIALLFFALVSSLVWVKSVDTILSIGMILASFMGVLISSLVVLGSGQPIDNMDAVANTYVEGMVVWSPTVLLIVFAFSGILKRNTLKESSEH